MDLDHDDRLARFDALDRAIAEQQVRPPGIALMVLGGLWAVTGLVAFAGAMLFHVMQNDQQESDLGAFFTWLLMMITGAIGLCSLAAGAITFLGGRCLFQLRSRRWARAAAATAMLPSVVGFLLCMWGLRSGALPPIALALPGLAAIGIPIGVWTAIVLRDDLVKTVLR